MILLLRAAAPRYVIFPILSQCDILYVVLEPMKPLPAITKIHILFTSGGRIESRIEPRCLSTLIHWAEFAASSCVKAIHSAYIFTEHQGSEVSLEGQGRKSSRSHSSH